MDKLRVLSLFAGIGGFDLGLERTGGFETVAFCEIDPFCRRVLAKHWPEVPCYEDVCELGAERLAVDGIAVDVICGGFPCQDISYAGPGCGLAGERSGLFFEIARLVGELRSRILLLENVAALLDRGLSEVLGTLAALRYDAFWHCIPAFYVGLPQGRDRIWIVAYANGEGLERRPLTGSARGLWQVVEKQLGAMAEELARVSTPAGSTGGIAYGVPNRMDRLRALGNSLVPQIPEMIGRAILAAEAERIAA